MRSVVLAAPDHPALVQGSGYQQADFGLRRLGSQESVSEVGRLSLKTFLSDVDDSAVVVMALQAATPNENSNKRRSPVPLLGLPLCSAVQVVGLL